MGAKRKAGEFITEGLQRKEAGVDDLLFAFFFLKAWPKTFPSQIMVLPHDEGFVV